MEFPILKLKEIIKEKKRIILDVLKGKIKYWLHNEYASINEVNVSGINIVQAYSTKEFMIRFECVFDLIGRIKVELVVNRKNYSDTSRLYFEFPDHNFRLVYGNCIRTSQNTFDKFRQTFNTSPNFQKLCDFIKDLNGGCKLSQYIYNQYTDMLKNDYIQNLQNARFILKYSKLRGFHKLPHDIVKIIISYSL